MTIEKDVFTCRFSRSERGDQTSLIEIDINNALFYLNGLTRSDQVASCEMTQASTGG